jgi:uncharacterized protein (TIGR03437 family)
LLKAFLVISAASQPGAAGVRFTHAIATDPDGNAVPLGGAPIEVRIQGPGIVSTPVQTVLNGASLLSGPVSPGEIITFFGFVPPASTLLFNGVPAPVLFAGSNQVNAIVPFGADVSGPATIELRAGNAQPLAKLAVPTAPVVPAIFIQTGTGAGPGAILNEDFSINSYTNPAAPGSVVMVYGTGFGALDPAAIDGQIASGKAVTKLPVTASIAGVPADVVYAGAAPGLVAGVTQINVRIPSGARPNLAAPVLLSIGSATTPAGPTLSIR